MYVKGLFFNSSNKLIQEVLYLEFLVQNKSIVTGFWLSKKASNNGNEQNKKIINKIINK